MTFLSRRLLLSILATAVAMPGLAAGTSAVSDSMPSSILLTVNGTVLRAELADNSSAEALRALLATGPRTIRMHDYASFEKVGELGARLPRNDESITTQAGDLILYLGSSFVIYYDTNSWDFTRLGRIQGISQAELKKLLGDGDVDVTLSLPQ